MESEEGWTICTYGGPVLQAVENWIVVPILLSCPICQWQFSLKRPTEYKTGYIFLLLGHREKTEESALYVARMLTPPSRFTKEKICFTTQRSFDLSQPVISQKHLSWKVQWQESKQKYLKSILLSQHNFTFLKKTSQCFLQSLNETRSLFQRWTSPFSYESVMWLRVSRVQLVCMHWGEMTTWIMWNPDTNGKRNNLLPCELIE